MASRHRPHKLKEEKKEEKQEVKKLPKAPKPQNECLIGCNPDEDACCLPTLDRHDPAYLEKPPKLTPECKADEARPIPRFEEVTKKRAFVADKLTKEMEYQKSGQFGFFKKKEVKNKKIYYDRHPETTRSIENLQKHPEFKIAGPNPMRVPHDELIQAMNGFTNMQLAHEICINHDFRLERYTPVDDKDSLHGHVRDVMMKAYWDQFDEALSSKTPNHNHAMSIFREIKTMMFKLLMPHNIGMRRKIEEFLDEDAILYEIKHQTIDVKKYSNFVVEVLGMLCCPVRDKEILAIRTLDKPSDLFKAILAVMEKMQLDMANFLISQIRPTVMANCVEYERQKFADFIEIEYKLFEDSLRVTRSWILRHRLHDRPPSMVIARAFVEILMWKEKEWPETLTLDWPRLMSLAQEAQRIAYVGAAVHGTYSVARHIFKEDDANLNVLERANPHFLKCFAIREKLRSDADILLSKEEVFDKDKLKHVLELVAEQAIKHVSDCMFLELDGQKITDSEKTMIRKTVTDCANEDNKVRLILLRRIQEYLADLISTGRALEVEVPRALVCIQTDVLKICVEFHRITMHNRAVFQDLYNAIIQGHCHKPKYMNKHRPFDPNLKKLIDILRAPSTKELQITRPAENDKLEEFKDEQGRIKVELEDLPVIETSPEIEQMIDRILEEADVQDDFDEFANISEKQAVHLLERLDKQDSETILRQMRADEESRKRIVIKKQKMREDLRVVIRKDMGLQMFHKQNTKLPGMQRYCKLLKAYEKEDAEKLAENKHQSPEERLAEHEKTAPPLKKAPTPPSNFRNFNKS